MTPEHAALHYAAERRETRARRASLVAVAPVAIGGVVSLLVPSVDPPLWLAVALGLLGLAIPVASWLHRSEVTRAVDEARASYGAYRDRMGDRFELDEDEHSTLCGHLDAVEARLPWWYRT